MNKLFGLLATIFTFGSLSTSAQDYTLTLDLGYESEYVFRGIKTADDTLMPAIEITWDSAYTGIWSAQPLKGNKFSEFDLYVGMGIQGNDLVSFDVGGTWYYYPKVQGSPNTMEVYVGANINANFDPAIYLYYDFDLKATTVEGSIGESFALGLNTTFDAAAFLGHVEMEGFNYSYIGLSADVVFSLNDKSSASVGVRYSDGNKDIEDEVWFGGSVSTGF